MCLCLRHDCVSEGLCFCVWLSVSACLCFCISVSIYISGDLSVINISVCAQGKTHTLIGNAADPGVTPRAIRNLFDLLYSSGLEFMVRLSYIEIYNEEINGG